MLVSLAMSEVATSDIKTEATSVTGAGAFAALPVAWRGPAVIPFAKSLFRF
jgi:hypothetical protein